MNFGILVLVLALVLFGVLAFLQLSALILAPLVSIFVIVCSKFPVELLPEGVEKMTILTGLKQLFMPAASAYVTSYFLVFFVGALLVLSISLPVLRSPFPNGSPASARANMLHPSSSSSP